MQILRDLKLIEKRPRKYKGDKGNKTWLKCGFIFENEKKLKRKIEVRLAKRDRTSTIMPAAQIFSKMWIWQIRTLGKLQNVTNHLLPTCHFPNFSYNHMQRPYSPWDDETLLSRHEIEFFVLAMNGHGNY